ncbi:APC family permease [Pseudomonas sp. UFMG81]|uniref:APC family permease n=1 Tax=Pseudomonas sp. UFMG81 TaxID=2745936 RepID=UPI00188E3B1B|nr:amino acid permease [Pseudomonas sp. UFMG81]
MTYHTANSASTTPALRRDFTLASTFSLAFAFVSPIVALYGIFGIGVSTLGAAFWWGFPLALAGQMLVALALGQLAARWPLQGGIYQWSRKLMGHRYGWFAGWFYLWTLTIAMAAVSYAGAIFLAELLGIEASAGNCITLACGLLAVTTLGNIRGRRVVKWMVALCIWAEIIGSVGIGVILLLFYRINSLDILFTAAATVTPTGGFFTSSLVVATALAGWTFLGFESASSISEEVQNPQRAVPLAMLLSLFFVAFIVMFSSLAILLAMPVQAVDSSDPVLATLAMAFPPIIVKGVLALFVIAFLASVLSIQAAVSRNVWAFAREGELPFARALGLLSAREAVPANAIRLTACIAMLVLFISSTNLYTWLVNFTAAGFFISFLFPTLALVIARCCGTAQRPGSLLAQLIPFIALAWLLFEILNLLWPRASTGSLLDWMTVFIFVGVGLLGLITRLTLPLPHRNAIGG